MADKKCDGCGVLHPIMDLTQEDDYYFCDECLKEEMDEPEEDDDDETDYTEESEVDYNEI